MIIIGSTAIKFWYPDFPREPKDKDYVVNTKVVNEPGIEYLYNPVLYDYIISDDEDSIEDEYPSPNILYTLKLSHTVGWKLENGSWDKHVFDIQFLKSKGCTVIWPLFWKLYEFWKTIHGPNKRSELEMTAEEFFDNALECPYNHDMLHEALITHPHFKGQPEPTYKKILIGEVDVSMEKFAKLSEEEKYNVVFEEAAVMAFERWPNIPYLYAYSNMIKKFILSHAKIEEAIWILENYKLLHKAKFDFIKHLNYELRTKGIEYTV